MAGSDARRKVIDRSGNRRMPVGVADFADAIQNCVVIDKSKLIADVATRGAKVTLFCRPRRFGKSLAMSMLRYYFEKPVEGIRTRAYPGLFDGLAVMDAAPEVLAMHQAHPVIFLTLAQVEGADWEETRDALAMVMADEYGRHRYLLEGDTLAGDQRGYFHRVLSAQEPESDLRYTLSRLCGFLGTYYGVPPVILIDEYDCPIISAHNEDKKHDKGYYDACIRFMRMWLGRALKAGTDYQLACLTGVQRVSHESIFSGLNNVDVDTALNHLYREGFGFVDAEVEELLAYVGRPDTMDEVRTWYDGYNFGGEGVYNPWSVINYVRSGFQPGSYWSNTSGNAILKDLVANADAQTREQVVELADGRSVEHELNLGTVFGDMRTNPEAVWSQLFLAGYLTTDDVWNPDAARAVRPMRIPNHEVRESYRIEIVDRARAISGGRGNLERLQDAVVAGDLEAFGEALDQVLGHAASFHDLTLEESYHDLLLGLLYQVRGYRYVRSNREEGLGRFDLRLDPLPENVGRLPVVVVEAKRLSPKVARGVGGEGLQKVLAPLAAEGLAQAKRLGYARSCAEGPGEEPDGTIAPAQALAWGIAFRGKTFYAACERL